MVISGILDCLGKADKLTYAAKDAVNDDSIYEVK